MENCEAAQPEWKTPALWDCVMEVAYKTELVIDSVVLGDKLECLVTVAGDIKHVKTEALKISDSIRNDNEAQRVTKNSFHLESQLSTPPPDEVLVGLDEVVMTITNRLTKGLKKLDIFSIVGMAGLGKTTLANTVYHHPSILKHFHIRVCCTVSQVYSKHNLLVQILWSVDYRFTDQSVKMSPDQYLRMDEDDLAAKLKRVLSRNMYLIVLDDVWDIEAWNLLKHSLPDDANGSRILFTSRSQNLSLQFKPDSKPYHLRQLTGEECFALLQRKIFAKENFPSTLTEVLQKILKKLPSIRKLKCVGGKYPVNTSGIVKLDSLSQLESLKLHYLFFCKFEFPMKLKKLTLSYNGQPWSEISTIGKLPNLEVLKLNYRSFEGENWEMQEGEFSNLRFLKLSSLNLCSWTANSDGFPSLEKLVLHHCTQLEEVPSCLGESSTIVMIEVQFGRESLVSSVEKIQQEQKDAGNEVLKIVISASKKIKIVIRATLDK